MGGGGGGFKNVKKKKNGLDVGDFRVGKWVPQ